MATNKESTVIIIDVGIGAEEFTKQAADCCLEVIKHKIYNHKVDMLSILLLRTERTNNVGNTEEPEQYLNISQVLPGSQVASWNMAREFLHSLDWPKTRTGDWVDALIVAIGIITEDAALHKTRLSKIILFHNFKSPPSTIDDEILAKLHEMDFKLIIVSNNIQYISDEDGKLRPQFKPMSDKSRSQKINEKLAMELLNEYPHTTFCNFNDALHIIQRKELPRPWNWNSVLNIGSRIIIHISGVIAIKEESVPKFKKKAKRPNEIITTEKKYYTGVDELTEDIQSDKIKAFMLGNTPVPYDPSLGQVGRLDTKKGIHFIGFVLTENVPQEYFTGNSTYIVFPQKGKSVSAKIMDSLVRAMLKDNVCILAWKVYNNGFTPKLMVLLPTLEYPVPSLAMIELCYHSQQRFWDFPKLGTKKNQPSPEQLAAVDELMAAMELSPESELGKETTPCESLYKDHLPFEFLPDIRQKHLLDYMASVLLTQTGRTEAAANHIKVPDVFQPKAAAAAEKIKTLFPLKKTEVTTKDKLKDSIFNNTAEESVATNGATTSAMAVVGEEFNLTHVGTVTPADDFARLISHIINRMPNGSERSAKFLQFASQMRSVITDLLFKSMTKQHEKVEKALVTYRKLTVAANSQYDYNDWMREIRAKVIERKMFDFWEDVIVKQKLGLCLDDDDQEEQSFYNITVETAAAKIPDIAMDDEDSVDNLIGNM